MQLMDLAAIATELGLKLQTVYVYHSTGQLPPPDIEFRGCVHWYPQTIDVWARVNKRGKYRRRRDR